MRKSRVPGRCVAALVAFFAFSSTVLAQAAANFDLPAQPLADSLRAVAGETNTDILFDTTAVAKKTAPALRAKMTVNEALTRLLAGTGIKYEFVNEHTVVLVVPSETGAGRDRKSIALPKRQADATSSTNAGAQAAPSSSQTVEQPPTPRKDGDRRETANGQESGLEEIVVTGTYLHHVEPLTPVKTITSDEMINQGFSRLDDALQSLPENFKGAVAQDQNGILGVGTGASRNYSFSSGVNLHGLGPNATLVLLNGQRMAPTAEGNSVDISQIPLSVIDRVEIMTDGASAIYGSDAIAGVVNIITKSNFTGLDVGIRSNSISDGKAPNYGASVTGGESWATGNIVGSVDFEKDNPLLARDRSFTNTLPDPTVLLPLHQTESVFLGLHESFTDKLTLTSEVLASRRSFEAQTALFGLGSIGGYAKQTTIAAELDYHLSSTWTAALIGDFSRERDFAFGAPATYLQNFTYDNSSVEGRADGELFTLPGGEVHAALGGSFRKESFNNVNTYNNVATGTNPSRHIDSLYGELLVPILADLPLVKSLRLDVTERYDHYSDFGGTSNPKIALQWTVLDSLKFHGSYGRSFKAPNLFELDPNGGYFLEELPVPYPGPGPGGTACSYIPAPNCAPALILDGNNPNLLAETAKTFNFGATYAPFRGLIAEASYFNVNYTNKIERVSDNSNFVYNPITSAPQLGSLLNLNPTLAEINSLLNSGRSVYNALNGGFCAVGVDPGCTVDPSAIKAIANLGYNNVGSSRVEGVDSTVRSFVDTRVGQFTVDTALSYYLSFKNRITPTSAAYSAVNEIYDPLKFRGNLLAGWSKGFLSVHARLNYANGYFDNSLPACGVKGCPVASWTTLDAGMGVNIPSNSVSIWRGLRLGLDVTNALNKDPPLVTGALPGLGYDPTNASPLGRAVALRVTKLFGGGPR